MLNAEGILILFYAAEAGDKATITLASGTVNFASNGTSPLNRTVTDIGDDAYIINADNSGEFTVVMKKANTQAYVLNDSVIRFMGVSVAAGPNGIALYGIGSLDDGMTLSTIYTNTTVSDVTYSDPVPTDTAVNGFNDLYSLDKYTFTISYSDNGTPKTFDATYSYFLVPAEVTAERTQHLDEAEIALVNALPILIIIGLVLTGVGAIFIRNRD